MDVTRLEQHIYIKIAVLRCGPDGHTGIYNLNLWFWLMPPGWLIWITSEDTLWILIGPRLLMTIFGLFTWCRMHPDFMQNHTLSQRAMSTKCVTRACSEERWLSYSKLTSLVPGFNLRSQQGWYNIIIKSNEYVECNHILITQPKNYPQVNKETKI